MKSQKSEKLKKKFERVEEEIFGYIPLTKDLILSKQKDEDTSNHFESSEKMYFEALKKVFNLVDTKFSYDAKTNTVIDRIHLQPLIIFSNEFKKHLVSLDLVEELDSCLVETHINGEDLNFICDYVFLGIEDLNSFERNIVQFIRGQYKNAQKKTMKLSLEIDHSLSNGKTRLSLVVDYSLAKIKEVETKTHYSERKIFGKRDQNLEV